MVRWPHMAFVKQWEMWPLKSTFWPHTAMFYSMFKAFLFRKIDTTFDRHHRHDCYHWTWWFHVKRKCYYIVNRKPWPIWRKRTVYEEWGVLRGLTLSYIFAIVELSLQQQQRFRTIEPSHTNTSELQSENNNDLQKQQTCRRRARGYNEKATHHIFQFFNDIRRCE